ncbi:MAG: rhomboid family intramembrane serine protease [Saprospiraceae bacterium]|nr:rhomboid family intramembrane serine protease [Saprospiraceae bacterium]
MSKLSQSRFYQSIRLPSLVILILWIIQGFQMFTGLNLGWLGVYPRHEVGIKGIFLSPFIHSQDVMHLINNSVPLFVGLAMILFFYERVAARAIILIYLLTGLGVWLFGRTVLHIGASGVIYGLISFIFWNGVFRRNIKSIVLALIILMLYSGMFLGVLPNQPGISWESHLIGAIVGILVYFIFRQQLESDEATMNEEDEPLHIQNSDEDFFLDRDTFEKPKSQRNQNQSDWFSDSTF